MGSDLAMTPMVEPARYCRTCKHWDPTHGGSGRHRGPSVHWHGNPAILDEVEDDPDRLQRVEKMATAVERLYGTCAGVEFLLTEVDPKKAPLAFTEDGSEYRAVLFTRPEFGCALWEERQT